MELAAAIHWTPIYDFAAAVCAWQGQQDLNPRPSVLED